MTSAHMQEDIRIFHKECVSLSKAGYEVYQISCGHNYDNRGIHLLGIGPMPVGRFSRMRNTAKEVYKEAVKLDADVYHLHDPELLPYGLKLKQCGKKVIFDSHEDIPAQIMDKEYIAKPLRKIISSCYKAYESYVVSKLDAVVAATPYIAKKFQGRCLNVVTINNFPRLDDIKFHDKPFEDRDAIICYAGGISKVRGEKIMIESMRNVAGKLLIAGNHEKMSSAKVDYLGHLNRDEVNELYGKSVVGLCLLQPIRNYYFGQPIKMYEYMAAGIPYICSDFPLWKKLTEESGSGICVNPEDSEEISNAISLLLNDRTKAQSMGKNGREYVVSHCTWEKEEKHLLELYSSF